MTDVPEVVHGGLQSGELAALGIAPTSVLDLSASLNPRGPHSSVIVAAVEADLRRYPPAHAEPLRDALAERAGLDPSQVLVTPGATAAIHLAARALLNAGTCCRLFPPTFGEYEVAARGAGGSVLSSTLDGPLSTRSNGAPVPLTMLCNPNNPTGDYLERRDVEGMAAAISGEGGTLLLDVAYDAFVLDAWDADDLVRAGAPVLVVHSMTKLHAIPGIRLGYVTGPAALISKLGALQHSWAVGSTAINAGMAALRIEEQQRLAVNEVTRSRQELAAALRAAGLTVRDSRANFFLVQVGDAPAFRSRLLYRGFAVRDCTSFGLPEWVRVAVPPEGAVLRLTRALIKTYAESPR
ncbi:MAG: histidinol-phosphate aminotransferase family protein [Dehalococcoidia bacterium]|nr:histidinol-phosphate aminotransferase family protein [Dehalococcoidia bacterium]